jgi:DNA polymerase III alpha subunit (gram-positive type)
MRAVIFDTETTGLIDNRLIPLDKQPEVIEFFALLVDLAAQKEINHLGNYIKPREAIDERLRIGAKRTAFSAHKIKNAMVSAAPAWVTVADKIKAFLEDADVVIAHNLSFDMEIVDIEMERCGLKVTWPLPYCTVEQTMHLKGCRLSLSALHTHLFGEGFKNAHKAEYDVRALARCVFELNKKGMLP